MTSTEIYACGAVESDPPSRTHSKSVLFCHDCEYEGPIDEWTVERSGEDRTVRCPNCGTDVQHR